MIFYQFGFFHEMSHKLLAVRNNMLHFPIGAASSVYCSDINGLSLLINVQKMQYCWNWIFSNVLLSLHTDMSYKSLKYMCTFANLSINVLWIWSGLQKNPLYQCRIEFVSCELRWSPEMIHHNLLISTDLLVILFIILLFIHAVVIR